MKNDPKHGEKWKHPEFDIGTVTITPNKHIEIDFENGMWAAFRTAKDFHGDGFVRNVVRDDTDWSPFVTLLRDGIGNYRVRHHLPKDSPEPGKPITKEVRELLLKQLVTARAMIEIDIKRSQAILAADDEDVVMFGPEWP